MIPKNDKRQMNYQNKKDNSKANEEKKQKLMQHFVENTKKTTTNEVQVSVEPSKTNTAKDKDLELLKDEINKLKKIIKVEKDKRESLKNDKSKLETKYKKVLDESKTSSDKIATLEEEIAQKDNKIRNLLDKCNELESQLSKLTREYERYKFKSDKKIEKYKENFAKIKDKINSDKYRKEVMDNEDFISSYENAMLELHTENEMLIKENKALRFNHKILKQREETFYASLKLKEVTQPSLKIEIQRIGRDFERAFNFFITFKIRSIRKSITDFLYDRPSNKTAKKDVVGVLKKGKFKYLFIDELGNEYRAKCRDDRTYFRDGYPCVANVMEDGTAFVWRVYSNIEKRDADIQKVKKKKVINVSTKQEIIKKYDVDINVLIITALNQDKYIYKLGELGINVNIFNSYSQTSKRLEEILSKYDLVFYCTRHSKHYCKTTIKKQKDYSPVKYKILKDDSVANIFYEIDEFLKLKEIPIRDLETDKEENDSDENNDK